MLVIPRRGIASTAGVCEPEMPPDAIPALNGTPSRTWRNGWVHPQVFRRTWPVILTQEEPRFPEAEENGRAQTGQDRTMFSEARAGGPLTPDSHALGRAAASAARRGSDKTA